MDSDGRTRPNIASELAERVARSVADGLGVSITAEQALVREAAPEHGCDYQSNVAMSLAKRLGRGSREVAQTIIDSLRIEDLCEPPICAGPGFINMRLRPQWLADRLGAIAADERLAITRTQSPRRVVVDYSAPNVAKEMHVGHLRSTIIGDALVRVLRFTGEQVIPQNHLGDWGTPFGMLIEHMLDEGWSSGAHNHTISDLNAFYKAAREKFDSSESFAERSRRRVVELQGGDPHTLELWRELVDESERHFQEVYDLLGVLLAREQVAAESFYNDQLAGLVRGLADDGLAVDSDGALCVFPAGFRGRDGEPVPLIVRKSDGAYTYDTTDLAALRHRVRELQGTELLYVVGAPQKLHFELVFAVAREAGWLDDRIAARHIAFGSVLGEDRKMLRTRSGEAVRLVDLLEEAIDRASVILAERGTPPKDRDQLARSIGIGAVKYADLCADREKDYVFSFERMLALEGNTSVYLQYANARSLSVLRRSKQPLGDEPNIELLEPAERALALSLIRLPEAIDALLLDYRPHKLCTYLHSLAVAFSTFYENCPVLAAEDPRLRNSRLWLCELTSRTLTLGLELLGIDAPERLAAPRGQASEAAHSS